jgi:flagellar assembly factor FliW
MAFIGSFGVNSSLACRVHLHLLQFMPTCRTKYHGSICFEPEQVLHVSQGLFGFRNERDFLLLEVPSARPVVFVQSIRSENLCFVTLPVQMIDPDYQLSASGAQGFEDFPGELRMSADLLCLALLTVRDRQSATANLKAPLIIDVRSHRGMQVIVKDEYSHYHPLPGKQQVYAD